MNDRVSIVYYEDDQTTERIETSDVTWLMKETRETTLRNLRPNEAIKYQMHTCRYSQSMCGYDDPCRDCNEYECEAAPDCAGSDIMCMGDETICPTVTLIVPVPAPPCSPPDRSSHTCAKTCEDLLADDEECGCGRFDCYECEPDVPDEYPNDDLRWDAGRGPYATGGLDNYFMRTCRRCGIVVEEANVQRPGQTDENERIDITIYREGPDRRSRALSPTP